jgi:tetratricopeptide (TPR) repeat protein
VHRRSSFLPLAVAILLGSGAARATLKSPYAAVDARARAELEGIAPTALPSWDAANAARDEGRYDEAAAAYRAVADIAPRFDHAHRRVCSSLSALRRSDEAVLECRAAMALRESPENEAALAAALVDAPSPPPAAQAEAYGLVLLAQKTQPDDPAITSIAARVALARGDGATFDRNVATLHRIAPDSEDTAFFTIVQDLDHEDVDGARAELAAHRILFRAERAAALDAMIDDVTSHPTPARTAWRVARVVTVLLGILLLAAALLRRRKAKLAA